SGFDCILVPLGNGIDGRYMTQLRCSAMVLPADGREPIVIADRRSNNLWVPEPWQTGREWAEPTGEALLDLGMERARIGVAGLSGGAVTHCSSIDGVVNHTALAQVMTKVPNARFEDATDVIGMVRYAKSDEEIAFVRESVSVASAGLDELIKRARPGADGGVVYADVLARMLELGSEYFPLMLTIGSIDSTKPRRYTNPPLGCRLKADTLITSEIHAIRGAQLTQVCQPILLGKIPDEWKSAIALQREVYDAGLGLMRPGTTFGALADRVAGLAKGEMKIVMQLNGGGYGDDGPVFDGGKRDNRARDLTMKAGNVFVWRPSVASEDGRIRFAWGGPVLLTESGCEPLFKREHGLVEIC
ncbi:MAG TPA: M24 family metallopeptidase, partial [Candidatus Binatia bacterium]|nr:M24 family metallopeptidase [Candidatus Binatia bacterium]